MNLIKNLVEKLEQDKKLYDNLSNHSALLSSDINEKVNSIIHEKIPHRTEEFFKFLNVIANKATFPQSELTHESVIENLTSREAEILNLIEESKNSLQKHLVDQKTLTSEQVVQELIKNIVVASDSIKEYYTFAKLKIKNLN